MNLDERTLLWIHEHLASNALDDIMPVVTRLGGTFGVYAIVAIVVIAAVLARRTPTVIVVVAGVWSAKLVNYVLKHVFERDRPQLWDTVVTERSPAFPSGHSAGAAAVACAAVLMTWNTRWRYPVLAAAVTYALLIGFSRMYLGVHYPSDVLVGWAVGAGWMALVWRLTRRMRTTTTPGADPEA